MELGQKNRMLEILMGKIVRNAGLLVLWIFGEKAGFFKIFRPFNPVFIIFWHVFCCVLSNFHISFTFLYRNSVWFDGKTC
jgi:hypothetical protein